MAKKYHKLHCEICNWTKVTETTGLYLYEIKRSPVPGGIPYLNEKGKLITPKPIKQPKKFRCPACGRALGVKEIDNPQEKIDNYRKELVAEEERKEWEVLDEEAKKRYNESRKEYEEEQKQRDIDGY